MMTAPEMLEWAREHNIRMAERAYDELATLRRHVEEATIQSGAAAIRSALLVNGGAVVVILGFLGAVSANAKLDDLSRVAEVTSTLQWFGWGTVCAMFALVFVYLTNSCHATIAALYDTNYKHPYIHENEKTRSRRRCGIAFNASAFIFGLSSLVFFIYGIYDVQYSVTRLLTARG
jgi:hypothetical protein